MRRLILFVALASAAFAQTDSNVLTITASRQVNTQPDEVSLAVTVMADPSQTLDKVLTVLQGTNITAADLVSVQGDGTPQVQWIFRLAVSFSDMQRTTAALAALKQVAYYVQGAATSPEAATAQQCPYPALINDAREQAGKLASAAGVTLGPILSMAQGSGQSAVPTAAVRLGDFVSFQPVSSLIQTVSGALSGFLLGSRYSPPVSAPSCSLTVQFQMGQ